MKKKRINRKALTKLLFIMLDILVMIVSGYHVFNLNRVLSATETVVHGTAFTVTFAFYCYLRYKEDSKVIGGWNVGAMLGGMVLALFGASNVLMDDVPESLALKILCYATLIFGGALYAWNDYKSEKLTNIL